MGRVLLERWRGEGLRLPSLLGLLGWSPTGCSQVRPYHPCTSSTAHPSDLLALTVLFSVVFAASLLSGQLCYFTRVQNKIKTLPTMSRIKDSQWSGVRGQFLYPQTTCEWPKAEWDEMSVCSPLPQPSETNHPKTSTCNGYSFISLLEDSIWEKEKGRGHRRLQRPQKSGQGAAGEGREDPGHLLSSRKKSL